ncbi:MAG: hypothetical protein ACK500_11180 [Flavobacteriales bacterium]
MRRILLHFLFLLAPAAVFGQMNAGARSASLAGASASLQDEWSVLNNQAGMAFLNTVHAGVFYESRFLVPGLGDKGLGVTAPVGLGAFGFSFRSFGFNLYSDSRAGLAYAIKLDEKISLGVQANFHRIRIAEGYGTAQTLTIEGGAIYKMTERLTIAAHLFNPTRSQIADFNDERMVSVLKGGASYLFGNKVRLLSEIRKPSDRKPAISAGVEYQVVETLAVRVGAGSNPGLTSFGLGWQIQSWRIDASSSYHAILGFSPQISLAYCPVKEK